MFKKILIANRGEIALRVICACKELGIKTVAVFSEADRHALHVRFADDIKAAAGGGGRGMRVVETRRALPPSLETAQAEAAGAFGSPRCYLEKYVERARHIEFQVMADECGNVVHLGERECSIQRRHQKLIEESPSVGTARGNTPGSDRPHWNARWRCSSLKACGLQSHFTRKSWVIPPSGAVMSIQTSCSICANSQLASSEQSEGFLA